MAVRNAAVDGVVWTPLCLPFAPCLILDVFNNSEQTMLMRTDDQNPASEMPLNPGATYHFTCTTTTPNVVQGTVLAFFKMQAPEATGQIVGIFGG